MPLLMKAKTDLGLDCREVALLRGAPQTNTYFETGKRRLASRV